MSDGRLQAIWIKTAKRGPMEAVSAAELVAGSGMVGNANQRGKRQVTIIEQEVWDELMRRLDGSLSASARRANFVVSGIRLANTSGRVLRIGSARIRILGETEPCPRMDEALMGLQEAMRDNWGGGAFGEVLVDARIAVGDTVSWEEAE